MPFIERGSKAADITGWFVRFQDGRIASDSHVASHRGVAQKVKREREFVEQGVLDAGFLTRQSEAYFVESVSGEAKYLDPDVPHEPLTPDEFIKKFSTIRANTAAELIRLTKVIWQGKL